MIRSIQVSLAALVAILARTETLAREQVASDETWLAHLGHHE